MIKPTSGEYLFIYPNFDDNNQPQLSLLADSKDEFDHLKPRGEKLTLTFDTGQRYCTGWYDLKTSVAYPCPHQAKVAKEYDQCRACQAKTGFNPAFYNASTISAQQEERNHQPHILYLAHFAPGTVKVGITWAGRGIKRLLSQGARSSLILGTYPRAELARKYEAKVAKLPGIAETLLSRTKYQLLLKSYNAELGAAELRVTRTRILEEVGINLDTSKPTYLDPYYFGKGKLTPSSLTDATKSKTISGHCVGMIGPVLIVQQGNMQFGLSLDKFSGYRCTLNYTETHNKTETHQASLF